MKRRWLVIYYDGDKTTSVIMDDDEADSTLQMPYGLEPNQVAEDCESITAIVLCADPPVKPFVVIDGAEVEWPDFPPNEDVPQADSEG